MKTSDTSATNIDRSSVEGLFPAFITSGQPQLAL